jgi:hypothetical protein
MSFSISLRRPGEIPFHGEPGQVNIWEYSHRYLFDSGELRPDGLDAAV